MARRILTSVAALALMGFLDGGVVTVAAQSGRTAPPAVYLTCHGYDEGATRAYNCIPEPSQQHHMRTFVPPVGSACDAGSIAEFPPGRIVFQIRCRDGSQGHAAAWSYWGRGSASFHLPVDASARLWVHTAFSGSSVHFVVRCLAPQQSVVVNELLGTSWGNNGTNGIYGMAGCREVEVDTGGRDLQWWFTQELAATALMPPQSWEWVTGAGSALPAQALQDLAAAVDLERFWGPPSHWGIQPRLGANDRAALRTPDAEGVSGLDLRMPTGRSATTRTAPLTLDLTCHGYVEGASGTRAYNCIPEPSQQHHMRTFVPPVGSACDAGSIAEFPPGRIVFQIRCRDSDGPAEYQITVTDVRFDRAEPPRSESEYWRYWVRVTATNTGARPFTGLRENQVWPSLFVRFYDRSGTTVGRVSQGVFGHVTGTEWNPGEEKTDTGWQSVLSDRRSTVAYYQLHLSSLDVDIACIGCDGRWTDVPGGSGASLRARDDDPGLAREDR